MMEGVNSILITLVNARMCPQYNNKNEIKKMF
jgi:hypothetical protein